MNIPNAITILRIIVLPFFINFLLYEYYSYALIIFILAGIGDALDGFLARVLNAKTRLGAYLDPLADKLMLTSAFVALTISKEIPLWVTVTIVSRDIIMIMGTLTIILMNGNYWVSPSIWGKVTTTMEVLLISLVLFSMVLGWKLSFLPLFMLCTMGLAIFSGLHYIYRDIGRMK